MEKQIYINSVPTSFWIEDTGRLRNSKTRRWLKGGVNKGYHFYSLYFRGKQYTFYTHRLVAEYFILNPNNLPVVHHKDGNRLNNFYLNLEWLSNTEHSATIERPKQRRKWQHILFSDINEAEMRQFRNTPYYVTKDGRIFNMSKMVEIRQEKAGNYYRVSMSYGLNGKHFLVHRVVWEAFNGEIVKGYDIDHLDGDPSNNALENLEMITHKENLQRRKMDYSYALKNFYRGE